MSCSCTMHMRTFPLNCQNLTTDSCPLGSGRFLFPHASNKSSALANSLRDSVQWEKLIRRETGPDILLVDFPLNCQYLTTDSCHLGRENSCRSFTPNNGSALAIDLRTPKVPEKSYQKGMVSSSDTFQKTGSV